MLMIIINGTNDNFQKEVLESELPVLVDFNATWCPPCQALHPILEEIANEGGDFKIVAVDIDDEEELAEKFNISSIPCLILFNDGVEVDRKIGLQPKKRLQKMLGVK
ncbi:MAG: thioredoxin [Candidatus Saccharibacteria bacterium]|nr:thioredoxin [Candidatus Saccharibacteria bacterium]